LLGVDKRVLCVANGSFAKRWHEIARHRRARSSRAEEA
jgi:aspartate aminotransferase-like enzyme